MTSLSAAPVPAASVTDITTGIPGASHLPVALPGDPAQFLAMIPYLLGYRPGSRDLILAGTTRPDQRALTIRMDLAGLAGQAGCDSITRAVAVLILHHCTGVTVAGLGPDRATGQLAAHVRIYAEDAGLAGARVLRADGSRYWTCPCENPAACPHDGTPYDPGAGPADAGSLRAAGVTIAASRQDLAATLAAAAGPDTESMRKALGTAIRRGERLARRADDPDRKAGRTPLEIAGVRAVAAAIRTARDGGTIGTHEQAAWLITSLAQAGVRHAALTRMDPAHHAAHQRLWAQLTRLAPAPYATGPACLLAFTAWQRGDGPLGGIALDRALADDPGDPLALVLRDALGAGLPPAMASPPPVLRATRARHQAAAP